MKLKKNIGWVVTCLLILLNAEFVLSATNTWSHELSNFTCKNGFLDSNGNLYLLGTNVSNLASYCLKYAPNGSLLQEVSLSNDITIDYKNTTFTVLNNGAIVGREAVLTYATPISTYLKLSYYDASFNLNYHIIIDPKEIAPDFDILPDIHIEPNGDIYLLLTQFQSNTLTNLKFVRVFSNLTIAWITDSQYHMQMYDGTDKAVISSVCNGMVYYSVNNVLFKINAETGHLMGFYQMFSSASDEGFKHKTCYWIMDKDGNKIHEYESLADSFDERSLCYMLDNGDFYTVEPDLKAMKVTVAFYDVAYPQSMISTGLIVLIIVASLSALSVLGYLVKKRF